MKQLQLLKLEDIFKLQQFKFYYKLVNKSLPKYFTQISIMLNSEVHDHNTRRRSIFVNRVSHEFSKSCIRYSLVKLINETPKQITDKVSTHSLQGYTNYIKRYFIEKYSEICLISDCYICNR